MTIDTRKSVRWLCVIEFVTWPFAPVWAAIFGVLLIRAMYRGDAIRRANNAVLFSVALVGIASFYLESLFPMLVIACFAATGLPLLHNYKRSV